MDTETVKLLREHIQINTEAWRHNAGEITKIYDVLIELQNRITVLEANLTTQKAALGKKYFHPGTHYES